MSTIVCHLDKEPINRMNTQKLTYVDAVVVLADDGYHLVRQYKVRALPGLLEVDSVKCDLEGNIESHDREFSTILAQSEAEYLNLCLNLEYFL